MLTQSTFPDLLHFRYKPKSKSFKDSKTPQVFKLFDWVIWLPDSTTTCRFRTFSPKTVLCLAHERSLRILDKLKSRLADTTIVIAGEDTNLSEILPLVESISSHAGKIYFEAKDIEHSCVDSFCMGFNSFYLNRVQPALITNLLSQLTEKTIVKNGVLAAWGAIWKHLDEIVSDRQTAIEFVQNSSWIQREELKPEDYWTRLSQSEFLLAPAGQGVQAPKLAEAWLMRTIPIVTASPCFADLQAAGFPMVILNNWTELTQEKIAQYKAGTSDINWEKVHDMLTVKHFQSCYLS